MRRARRLSLGGVSVWPSLISFLRKPGCHEQRAEKAYRYDGDDDNQPHQSIKVFHTSLVLFRCQRATQSWRWTHRDEFFVQTYTSLAPQSIIR
jgi:hypothetical protein